jgi:adenine deaminase
MARASNSSGEKGIVRMSSTLVAAGLTRVEALRAATSTPARRFGLTDRGRIEASARADLLLVDGDPTTTISDTLSIKGVWRRGVHQAALAWPSRPCSRRRRLTSETTGNGRASRTSIALTREGRAAFDAYSDALRHLLSGL